MHVIVRADIGGVVALRNSEIERLEITQELSAHTRCRLFFMRDHDTDWLVFEPGCGRQLD